MYSTPPLKGPELLCPLGKTGFPLFLSLLSILALADVAVAYTRVGLTSVGSAIRQSAVVRAPEAQKIIDAGLLEPGKPVAQELAGGEVHSYRITLAVGQFLKVLVDQRGIDLVLTLYDPNNKKITEADSPVEARGTERISVIADVAGSYRLELRPKLTTLPRGRYEAKIADLRTAQPHD